MPVNSCAAAAELGGGGGPSFLLFACQRVLSVVCGAVPDATWKETHGLVFQEFSI